MSRLIKHETVFDVLGIGLGPFNLGLAALLKQTTEIKALFIEQKSQFNWHPGLLLEGTTLQVPFMADLVTMIDPTHPLSFLNYLREQGRLYHFYFLEEFHIPRREFNHYCQWAVGQLNSCSFGQKVTQIDWKDKKKEPHFEITAVCQNTGENTIYHAKHIVLGVGSQPYVAPSFQKLKSDHSFHAAQFLEKRERCRQAKSITVVGSGQSAAEVFYELLQEQKEYPYQLNWLTRSAGYFPMEYSKLGLEHFSPDYIDYFYQLAEDARQNRLRNQDLLYKGISADTIADIYDLLYERTVGGAEIPVKMWSQIEVQEVQEMISHHHSNFHLQGFHHEQQRFIELESDVIIWGTGYQHQLPDCLDGIRSFIEWDAQGRYKIKSNYELMLSEQINSKIFVQNGELHTHGVGAPDLGLGAYRNGVIINSLLGREVYPIQKRNVFQQFGVPQTNNDQGQ